MRETISVGGILLPGGLLWTDEYSPSVSEVIEPLLSGDRYVEETAIISGRPVTLVTGSDQILTRSQLDALQATMTTGASLTLILTDDRELTVRWRHRDGAIDATPAGYHENPPPPSHPYFVTLRLEVV